MWSQHSKKNERASLQAISNLTKFNSAALFYLALKIIWHGPRQLASEQCKMYPTHVPLANIVGGTRATPTMKGRAGDRLGDAKGGIRLLRDV